MPLPKRVISLRPDCVRLFNPFFPAVLFSDTCFFSSAASVKILNTFSLLAVLFSF